jgi:hypothetical protein
MILLLTNVIRVIKLEDEMDGARGTYGGERYVQGYAAVNRTWKM